MPRLELNYLIQTKANLDILLYSNGVTFYLTPLLSFQMLTKPAYIFIVLVELFIRLLNCVLLFNTVKTALD